MEALELGRSMKAPIFIGDLELTAPISDIKLPVRDDGTSYNGVFLLVKLQRTPVGYAFLPPHALDAQQIARQLQEQLGDAINELYRRAGLPGVNTLPIDGLAPVAALSNDIVDRPMISVVVCTRDRPESIINMLRSVTAVHYEPFEIVVVDNAPSSDATRDAVLAEYGDDPRIRYVREPRPGVSCAKNRGLLEASADIVAFTDDDVTVDPWWLDGVVRGFRAAPEVACVTGLVATARLENAVQLYFHLRQGLWVCNRRIFDLTENRDDSPLFPYSPGKFGMGANFAVTRALMKEIGPFDEALGAGTVTGAGEDIDIFMRIILSGNRIVYEPTSIVSHYHRVGLAQLDDQMLRYGSGFTAALCAIALRVPRARYELPLKILRGIPRMFTLNDRTKDNSTLPPGLMKREYQGFLIGPALYYKARRRLRQYSA